MLFVAMTAVSTGGVPSVTAVGVEVAISVWWGVSAGADGGSTGHKEEGGNSKLEEIKDVMWEKCVKLQEFRVG